MRVVIVHLPRLCASLFHQNVIHADAPELRECIQIIRTRQIHAPLPVVDALRAGESQIFLQLIHTISLLQPQAADVPSGRIKIDNWVLRKLSVPHTKYLTRCACSAADWS